MVNGVSSIILTKLDCLSGVDVLKVCVGYASKGGAARKSFPAHIDEVALASPVYEELPGWQEEIQGATDEKQLPAAARQYIDRLEELLKVKVALISTGPDRNDIIVRQAIW
jgi:adenylosuccinate synthase